MSSLPARRVGGKAPTARRRTVLRRGPMPGSSEVTPSALVAPGGVLGSWSTDLSELDFRTWLVVGGRHGMGGSPDAGRFLPALEEEHRSYAWATKWKLSGPTERSSVVRMAAALLWGPWTKKGLPWRPKPMALGPVHGPRCPAVAWKPGAGSKPRLRA